MIHPTGNGSLRGTGPGYRLAVAVGAVLNPFALFTALFAATAFSVTGSRTALAYVGVELAVVGVMAAYLAVLRFKSSSGFWLPAREERLIPAFVLLSLGVVTVALLDSVAAPAELVRLTLAMLATVSLVTLAVAWIKASAHLAVACHCAVTGVAVLGAVGLVFAALVPAVAWARLAERAHTPAETAVGAAIGTGVAAVAGLL